ncbi:MAG: right-handed parallel beta-helix repeat-containing protein [Halieaceae bacterium]|nr:right-handed parallel beta-helix repeat-containing protein [Halieaceae bacterium]MCP5147867.1 right-handed parallel beta-helix repeat-containing protein [Pseudomonadales bacterium]MCP5187486.1 right-handed parallel beta-helix repeat-containing protein [Pseudomonadales bacterium]
MNNKLATSSLIKAATLLLALGVLGACSGGGGNSSPAPDNTAPVEDIDPNLVVIEAGDDFQTRLMEALIEAQPGNIIELPAGEFTLNTGISLDVDNVVIRGQGHTRSILNFGAQESGGESVLVTSNNVVLQDFAVIDPPADGIKYKFSNGVTMRGMRVEWTCGPCSENGAYGIYPVQTENVLIEDSVVIGASDAGIYVGQSDKIIVRRNLASLNVAGIEIENSTNSEVYDNEAVNNTGGILVFDLPNLSREGTRTKVYNNVMRDNNTPNFAPPGSIVGVVPTGTGMLIMAFTDVEVFDNIIENNQSSAIAIVHYDISGRPTDDVNYDGTPRRVYIHDNQIRNNAYQPSDLAAQLGPLFADVGGLPQIFYDGIGEQAGRFAESDRICVAEDPAVKRGILFGANGASTDPAYFDCAHASLPEVVLDTPEEISEGEKPLTDEEIAQICTPDGEGPNFDAVEVTCDTLSAYNLFADPTDPRANANGGIHYEMITPLFTDYAQKYRFVFVPEGKQAAYNSRNTLDFPVGTIIAKTFTMPHDFLNDGAGEEIIETRLLIHRKEGWKALPFIWREDRGDADLALAGGTRAVSWIHSDGSNRSTNYVIPDANSCKTCHSTVRSESGSGVNQETVLIPIGPKARFLNRDNRYEGESVNQLAYMAQQGALAGLPDDLDSIDTVPDWEDTAADLQNRAKGYLDANCAHCHSPGGFASNSGLFMEYWREVDTSYGICKTPVAAGAGSGGLRFDIVPGNADQSITSYRMDSNQPDVRMPEIGRTLIHDEGVALVREWINSLSGQCE